MAVRDASAKSGRYRRLPTGAHGLDPEEVRRDQRERLQTALIELIAERGYQAVRILDLTKLARVSRPTFYSLYADKEELFLAAYDEIAKRTAKTIMDGLRHAGLTGRAPAHGDARLRRAGWRRAGGGVADGARRFRCGTEGARAPQPHAPGARAEHPRRPIRERSRAVGRALRGGERLGGRRARGPRTAAGRAPT